MPADTEDGRQWVAVAAVIVRGDTLLTLRRAPGRVGALLWETVSGRVRPGEEPRAALEREIIEETGLEVRVGGAPVDAYAARRGDEPMVVLVYRAEHVSGEVVRSDEHDEHAWVTIEELAARSTLRRLVEAARVALASRT